MEPFLIVVNVESGFQSVGDSRHPSSTRARRRVQPQRASSPMIAGGGRVCPSY